MASTRTRLVNMVLGHWKFSSEELSVSDIESLYGRNMTSAMRSFVAGVIATVSGVLAADPAFKKELWGYSEIASSIESNREEVISRRRIHYIHDGPCELPGVPDAVVD